MTGLFLFFIGISSSWANYSLVDGGNPNYMIRTFQTFNFSSDVHVRKILQENQYTFGFFEEVNGYQDPYFIDGLNMPSPFDDPKYDSYDAVVVINIDNVFDEYNSLVEPAQHLRFYIRPEARQRLIDNGWYFHHKQLYDPDTGLLYYWKMSSARRGRTTPRGHFNVLTFSSNNKAISNNHPGAPMPWAVFFAHPENSIFGTHGTVGNNINLLGTPASAGCVRLETQRARDLFLLIGLLGRRPVDRITRDGLRVKSINTGEILQSTQYTTLYIVK